MENSGWQLWLVCLNHSHPEHLVLTYKGNDTIRDLLRDMDGTSVTTDLLVEFEADGWAEADRVYRKYKSLYLPEAI